MPWIPRGLREGVVTSRYPRRPDGYDSRLRTSVHVTSAPVTEALFADVVTACPTTAISGSTDRVQLDRGRCINCGRCGELVPELFVTTSDFEVAELVRDRLVVSVDGPGDDDRLAAVRRDLARRTRALRRSIFVRHVDAGSDGTEEWEIAALTGPLYDVQRLGIYFTASPRHADVLLVTGLGSVAMREALLTTYEAMPHPKVVVALGTDAISGGSFGQSYASHAGVADLLHVDVFVPGSPPTPFSILHGLLLATGLLSDAPARKGKS